MSLLSTFLSNQLIPALETALIAHEPDVQAAILGEIQDFSSQLVGWLEGKIGLINASNQTSPKE